MTIRKLGFACIAALLSTTATAAIGQETLTIDFVGAASAAHPVQSVQLIPSVGFDSTTSLGACPLVDGKVYFEGIPEDTGITAILLAAKFSGQPVRIYWDDSFRSSRGYCMLLAIRAY